MQGGCSQRQALFLATTEGAGPLRYEPVQYIALDGKSDPLKLELFLQCVNIVHELQILINGQVFKQGKLLCHVTDL